MALLSSDFKSCSFLLPSLAPLAISSTFIGTEESFSTGTVEVEVEVDAGADPVSVSVPDSVESELPRNRVPAFLPGGRTGEGTEWGDGMGRGREREGRREKGKERGREGERKGGRVKGGIGVRGVGRERG